MSYEGKIYNQPALALSFGAWYNQASSVSTVINNDAVNIKTPKNSTGVSISGLYCAAPATPYTIIASISANPINTIGSSTVYNPYVFGFTDGTKVVAIMPRLQSSSTQGLWVDYCATYSIFSTDLYVSHSSGGDYPYQAAQWLMLRDDGTNIYFYMSGDNQQNGSSWVQIFTEARATHLTPSNIIFGSNPWGSCATNVTLNSATVFAV